jgi:hypothetical protein
LTHYREDFVSEHRELYRALRITRALFPDHRLCFLGDAGLDDQRLFAECAVVRSKFIIRACHNRTILVYHEARQRWEEHLLEDYAQTLPARLLLRAAFRHAHRVRTVHISLTSARDPADALRFGGL